MVGFGKPVSSWIAVDRGDPQLVDGAQHVERPAHGLHRRIGAMLRVGERRAANWCGSDLGRSALRALRPAPVAAAAAVRRRRWASSWQSSGMSDCDASPLLCAALGSTPIATVALQHGSDPGRHLFRAPKHDRRFVGGAARETAIMCRTSPMQSGAGPERSSDMADKPPRKASKAEFRKMKPQVVERARPGPGSRAAAISRSRCRRSSRARCSSGTTTPRSTWSSCRPMASRAHHRGRRQDDRRQGGFADHRPAGAEQDHRDVEGPHRPRCSRRPRTDIMALAWNNATYADGAPELAPPDLWPAPPDGYRLRHYPLAQYAKADGERIQPRVFRSTNMLVNLFVHYKTRRDTTKLSPHWHDDFEQASLTLNGRWVHHMRYNWGPDLEHLAAGRSRRDGHAVGHHHPGDRRAYQPRRRRRRDVALRHLLPAADRLRAQEGLRHQRGANIRCPTCRWTTRSRPAAACSSWQKPG